MGFTYLLKMETYAEVLFSVRFFFFQQWYLFAREWKHLYFSHDLCTFVLTKKSSKKMKEFLEETSFFNDALDRYSTWKTKTILLNKTKYNMKSECIIIADNSCN